MNLINNVAAILDSKKSLDDLYYLESKVEYKNDLYTLPIDVYTILPNPPKNSSSSTHKELQLISRSTKSRSSKELELIYIVDRDPLQLFYNFLNNKGLAFPKSLFDQHYNVLEQYVYALKNIYNRARPEQVAPYYNINIEVLYTDTHYTPSYPSGHTMYSELAAYILSDKYPTWRKEFFQLSEYCSLARILQGVHYPSDTKASKLATKQLYPLMKGIEIDKLQLPI
jgi:hypothetical protein